MLSRSKCNSNAVSVPSSRGPESRGEVVANCADPRTRADGNGEELYAGTFAARVQPRVPRCFWLRVTWPFHLPSCPRHVDDRVPADDLADRRRTKPPVSAVPPPREGQ